MENEQNKEVRQNDYLGCDTLNRMSLTLNRDEVFEADSIIPNLWHWLYFLPRVKSMDEGNDGHPATGGFLPALEGLDRRMWAGGRLVFHDDLRAGKDAEKVSAVKKITQKQGRSGKLGFVLVEHQVFQNGCLKLTEEHDIVYKQAPQTPTTVESVNKMLSPPDKAAQWEKAIAPTPVLLFKYSALTFNGHRIHYDAQFCKEDFGFPGLVVHGPLIATLLMELLRQHLPVSRVKEFSFRALGPIFVFQKFRVCACRDNAQVHLWAVNEDGLVTMSARATVSDG